MHLPTTVRNSSKTELQHQLCAPPTILYPLVPRAVGNKPPTPVSSIGPFVISPPHANTLARCKPPHWVGDTTYHGGDRPRATGPHLRNPAPPFAALLGKRCTMATDLRAQRAKAHRMSLPYSCRSAFPMRATFGHGISGWLSFISSGSRRLDGVFRIPQLVQSDRGQRMVKKGSISEIRRASFSDRAKQIKVLHPEFFSLVSCFLQPGNRFVTILDRNIVGLGLSRTYICRVQVPGFAAYVHPGPHP